MNRSRKDVLMMVVMGALLVFAVFNFGFKPQRSQLSAAQDDLGRIEQDIAGARQSLDAPVVTQAVQAEATQSAVPAEPQVALLFRQLNAMAEDTGVMLSAVSPTPLGANPNGPGGSLQISITASGSHAAVLDYVQRLRDSDRLAVVEQVAIGSQAAPLADQTDQLQLSVRVFTLRAPIEPGAAQPTVTSAP